MANVNVKVTRLKNRSSDPLALPKYATAGSAGLDLCADVPFELAPGAHKLVPTGLAIALPAGFEGQVRPRSGLATKHGITVLNAPGTIDSDYRGEVQVCLVNHGGQPYRAARGERIAQLVIAPVVQADLVEVAELDSTARGEGGFGSTGK
ncbi:MAG TPA: dUTP diphosphatase [Myxococcales bacterium]|jgi:dUTP pyrophosphatase